MSEIDFDHRFVMSMMPRDLRTEVSERLMYDPSDETMTWWEGRSEQDFETLAYWMMNDDNLWSLWYETFRQGAEQLRSKIMKDETK